MQAEANLDVTVCEYESDLDLSNLTCKDNLVAFWGPKCLVTYCTRT
jgi:hypothetical protein